MRGRHSNEPTNNTSQDKNTNGYPTYSAQPRTYETIKARLQATQHNSRKHNSPDANRYRQSENRTAYNAARKGRTPDHEDKDTKHRKDREDPSPEYVRPSKEKPKDLVKSSSNPNLNQERQAAEENQDYQKLHEKLSFIESKIADMKRHVQKKREEKQQLV